MTLRFTAISGKESIMLKKYLKKLGYDVNIKMSRTNKMRWVIFNHQADELLFFLKYGKDAYDFTKGLFETKYWLSATKFGLAAKQLAGVLNPDRNANNQTSCNLLFNPIAQFTVGPNSKVTKNLTFRNGTGGDEARLNKLQPNAGGNDRKYIGSVKFTSSASGDAISLPITLRKQTGDRFTGP